MKQIYQLALVSVFPLAVTSFIWLEVWNGVASRAIDGSGHYAIAQIFDRTTFPDTFGWTQAYFAGMPFPNFYPPLFFWCVSIIHHTNVVSFATAFKLVVALPLLLIPAAFWAVVWIHSGKNSNLALATAISAMTLITIGELFQPSTGLDQSSTLMDGFYTQPLGFLLLLLWTIVYLAPRQKNWHLALASVLLALTVLANFFNAITAILFIVATLSFDFVNWYRAVDHEQSRMARKTFLFHLLSPCVALALAAFWIVPMLSTYGQLVTRPVITSLSELITAPLLCWYVLAGIGIVLWKRRGMSPLGPYIATILAILTGLLFSGIFAARWFPLQSFRFFSTANLLLSIPVGIAVSHLVGWFRGTNANASPRRAVFSTTVKTRIASVAITIIALSLVGLLMSTRKLTRAYAFYSPDDFQRIENVLQFARSHRDGRYLVEVLPSTGSSLVRADSLALNSYLGAQGNETTSVVYREASPNSSFFNAELNAFSAHKENFGISSVLMDDLDFINQPLTQHFKRLQFIGVRYLVIATPEMKERLSREPQIGARYDIGNWSVFELKVAALPAIRELEYRPALVVSDFTVKLRRQNQLDFVRLAEEQFSDAWFDVLLTRAPETKIDRLQNLALFGALIIDTYDFDDEPRTIELLKEFAQTRPLILLETESALFKRIELSLSDFPHAVIIKRHQEPLGEWVESGAPSHSYSQSLIREIWRAVRSILEREKISVASANIKGLVNGRKIDIRSDPLSPGESRPILIASTFHPKWMRSDNEQLYAVTPFFTLGFINQPTQLVFERSWYDRIALWISLATLLFLVAFVVASSKRTIPGSFARNHKKSQIRQIAKDHLGLT